MPGICMSIMAIRKGSPASGPRGVPGGPRGCVRCASALTPQDSGVGPSEPRGWWRCRPPPEHGLRAYRPAANCPICSCSGCLTSRMANQNSEPRPASLSTPISPPIISTSCFEMAGPGRCHRTYAVVEESAWVNFWKSNSRLSVGMPMPVSRTEKRITAALSVSNTRLAFTMISP